MTGLHIAIADDETDVREWLQETLEDMGHDVSVVASTAQELLAGCSEAPPDLVVTDIKMPGDLDGIDVARALNVEQLVPVVLLSAFHDAALIARAEDAPILGYLVKPIGRPQLRATVAIARRRGQEMAALHAQSDSLRQALEDRKLVERAKGILMRRAQLDESAAFRRLQRTARNDNKTLAEVARMILGAESAFAGDA